MQIRRKTVSILMLVLSLAFAGVSCSREDIQTDVNLSKLKPGEVSVGISLDALTLPVGNEGEIRALSMTMNNSTHNGKPSYGVVKMNRQAAAATISSVGVFYCPTDPTGTKVYYTDPAKPMTWELVNANSNDASKPLLYKCTQGNIVNIPKILLDGTHEWYFMGVVGAKQAADGTLTFKPSEGNTASGYDYQDNGSNFNLEGPMTSGWVKINLKVRPDDLHGYGGGTEPYFYPENWELKPVGNGSKAEPTIKFKPRGTLFRILVTNKAGYNLKITDVNLRSNVMAFDASITPESIRALNVPTADLAMPLKHGSTDVLLDVRDNTVSETQTEKNNPGAILVWGLINEKLYKEVDAAYQADNLQRFPYFAVRASAYPTDKDMWTSAEKQSDYFPLKKRASAVSGKPVFFAKVSNISTMYRDGGQQWLSVNITSSLSNLETMNFEPIASDGGGTLFKASHPFLNRHSDAPLYWLDQVAYPDYNQTLTWINNGNFSSRWNDKDITSNSRSKNGLNSKKNGVEYHLPYKEEILEFLPMPKGEHGRYSDLVKITNTSGYQEIKTDVVEPTYNLKNGQDANKIYTAVHHLRLGSAQQANMNFLKDLKTKQSLTASEDQDREDMSQWNLFNYFWHKRVVYSLAYLNEGDPESLVAFRYAWVSSPNWATGLFDSRIPDGFWNDGRAPLLMSEDIINRAKTSSRPFPEDIIGPIRDASAWTAGRFERDGRGQAMVSAFVVAMKPIGSFDERVRSIRDLDVVAQESFWTENPKNLVFRIIPASGFSTSNSSNPGAAVNRNRGAYLMTRDIPAGGVEGKDFYYFYVGPDGWGLFNTMDSEKLNEEFRLAHKYTTYSRYDTPEKQQAKFRMDFNHGDWTDDNHPIYDANQYYISRAFPKTGSGMPARFMVGPTLQKPTK